MNLIKAASAAIALSTGFILLYSFIFGVKFEDIASLGFTTILLSSSLVVLRLITQGIRFHILTSILTSARSVAASVFARISSEFVSLTTPTFVGGEAVRIAWLKARGADLGKTVWLVFLEIYLDVASTAIIVYASAVYLMLIGEQLLAILSAAVSTVTTAFFTLIFVYSKKKNICVPNWLQRLALCLLGKDRGGRVISSVEKSLVSYHVAAKNRSLITPRRVLGAVICTLLMIILSGVVTYLIFSQIYGLVGLLLSIGGFYTTLVISTLPITLGGSGVSELVLNHFTANIFGISDWAKVITWRLITYHIPLIISGFSLMILSYKELALRVSIEQKGSNLQPPK